MGFFGDTVNEHHYHGHYHGRPVGVYYPEDRTLEAALDAQYYRDEYHHEQHLRDIETRRLRNQLRNGKKRVRAEGRAEGFAEGKKEGRQEAVNEQTIHNRAYAQGQQDLLEGGPAMRPSIGRAPSVKGLIEAPPPRSRASSADPYGRHRSHSRAGSLPPQRRLSNGPHSDHMGGIYQQQDYVQQTSHRRRGPPVSNQAFFDRHNNQFAPPPSSYGGAPPSLYPGQQPFTGPAHWKKTVAPGSSISEDRLSQLGEANRSVYRGNDRRRHR